MTPSLECSKHISCLLSLVFLFFVGMKVDTTILPLALHHEQLIGAKRQSELE